MSIDTYNYFLIVLCGFMTVWSYRKATYSRVIMGDFEYLGFSVFWGTILVGVFSWWYIKIGHSNQLTILFGDPYAFGLILSILGLILGGSVGRLLGIIKEMFR